MNRLVDAAFALAAAFALKTASDGGAAIGAVVVLCAAIAVRALGRVDTSEPLAVALAGIVYADAGTRSAALYVSVALYIVQFATRLRFWRRCAIAESELVVRVDDDESVSELLEI